MGCYEARYIVRMNFAVDASSQERAIEMVEDAIPGDLDAQFDDVVLVRVITQ